MLQQRQAGAVLALFGTELRQFLSLLPQLFGEGPLLAGQPPLALVVQCPFVFGDLWRLGDHLVRQLERAPLGFGGKAFDLRGQGVTVGLALTLVRQEARVIQAQ